MQLVECVPNFSEGRNHRVINAITDAIKSIDGVSLLDVDPGASTNRTVVTFVGTPDAVVEAAFQGIQTAANLIDMKVHQGEHPRMGATDVCPFVPVSGVTMQDCAKLAERLGQRVGEELKIPVYLYAEAATREDRRSLADIRQGEYEALPEKMKEASFKPDFGPSEFNAKSGATVIGARQFLIAYNVNLNTKSKKLANEIAFSIREAGRSKRDDKGDIVKDAQGNKVKVQGTLKACRAVGWYVDEYKRAQVSINLIDFEQTSLHHAFDECCAQAERLGLRVTGSEIVGLVPLKPMLEAGRHYLSRQGRSTGVPDNELLDIAVQSLGLCDVAPFDKHKKVIEFQVAEAGKLLADMTVNLFLDELSSESAAPGGGSVAALCGALSAALSSMVANLTYEKKGFESVRHLMNELAEKGQVLKTFFARSIDDDMKAFNMIIEARRMPKASDDEKAQRTRAIIEANQEAIRVPMSVLQSSTAALDIAEQVVEKGNPNSLSDGGVAGLAILAAAEGAYYNVLINLGGFAEFDKDDDLAKFVEKTRADAEAAICEMRTRCEDLRRKVLSRLQSGL